MIGKTLTQIYEDFLNEINKRIENLIYKKGHESRHNGNQVLHIHNDDLMKNLDVGHPSDSYVVEIGSEGLISNYGHTYNLDTLPMEELCEILDSIEKQPCNFRVGTMDVNGTMAEFDKYFDDETEAYEHFIDIRAKIIGGEHHSEDVWIEKLVTGRTGREYESTVTYNLAEDEEQSEVHFE
jgi:hypothetical protein